jgi:DNA-binding transcriptional ArsR family regulator
MRRRPRGRITSELGGGSGQELEQELVDPVRTIELHPVTGPLDALVAPRFGDVGRPSGAWTILERLAKGPATITQLAEPFGITLTGLKKHVQILEEAELVTTEKRGRARECRLGPARLDDAARWIERYRVDWETRMDRLEAVIERRKGAKR